MSAQPKVRGTARFPFDHVDMCGHLYSCNGIPTGHFHDLRVNYNVENLISKYNFPHM